MSAPEVFQLSLGPLTGVAFGPDRSQVAVSPNNNEVQIYSRGSGDSWDLQTTLAEHDKLITAISWAPQTNRIVTCSQDRNAYVWTPTPTGEWKPALVLLRLNRAATCVKWSPREDKFAVGSGARAIAVCSFDEENNWWVSKHIKKPLRSTVLSIDWHPNNVLLAAGTTDAKAIVFSAFIKGIDSKPEGTVWGDRLPFNTICGEFKAPNGGWVHDVAFSPSGNALAYVSHDSAVNVVYPTGAGEAPVQLTVRTQTLPYLTLTWTAEDQLIAAGHDCQPTVFAGTANGWTFSHSLDDPSQSGSRGLTPTATGTPRAGAPGRLNNEAFNLFKQADSRGQAKPALPGGLGSTAAGVTPVGADGSLLTVHQNSITWVEPYEWAQNGDVAKVTTAGKDGRLVIWNVAGKGLASRMGSLNI
ncbi:Actin-related protein 2/3 complex subunit 1 [Vanrija pseudolonga]|uniref:Actin-related protein 2/3 complex subunit n=1 Tax=Vanrija pseudolonga TaxID=143232 RepID=A0AAF0YDQ0_9TREE|nr:Actin-related protein 2/3 complex subunit 1 [Vanrija pseudolonga]